jgi:hypothetical protein
MWALTVSRSTLLWRIAENEGPVAVPPRLRQAHVARNDRLALRGNGPAATI